MITEDWIILFAAAACFGGEEAISLNLDTAVRHGNKIFTEQINFNITVEPDGYNGIKWNTPKAVLEKRYRITPDSGISYREIGSVSPSFDRLFFIDNTGFVGAYITYSDLKVSDKITALKYLTKKHGKSKIQYRRNITENKSLIEESYYEWQIGNTYFRLYFYEDTKTHECSMICDFSYTEF